MAKIEIGEYKSIRKYVRGKIKRLLDGDKTFSSLYPLMFSEESNVMEEHSDGYRIVKTTYGECRAQIEKMTPALSDSLSAVPTGKVVGLYMENSLTWIQVFWAILKCGYVPLLMNTRLDDERLQTAISDFGVAAVVSDGKDFDCPTVHIDEILERIKEKTANGGGVLFKRSRRLGGRSNRHELGHVAKHKVLRV